MEWADALLSKKLEWMTGWMDNLRLEQLRCLKAKKGMLSDRIIFVNYAVIQRVEEITNHLCGRAPMPLFTTCHDKG